VSWKRRDVKTRKSGWERESDRWPPPRRRRMDRSRPEHTPPHEVPERLRTRRRHHHSQYENRCRGEESGSGCGRESARGDVGPGSERKLRWLRGVSASHLLPLCVVGRIRLLQLEALIAAIEGFASNFDPDESMTPTCLLSARRAIKPRRVGNWSQRVLARSRGT